MHNIIESAEGCMSVYAPPTGDSICLGGAYSDGARPGDGPWVVYRGDGFKREQICVVETASDARDALEREFGRLLESDVRCNDSGCPQCCAHGERDHGICLDCGQEEDPGAAIDRACDALEDR